MSFSIVLSMRLAIVFIVWSEDMSRYLRWRVRQNRSFPSEGSVCLFHVPVDHFVSFYLDAVAVSHKAVCLLVVLENSPVCHCDFALPCSAYMEAN